MKLVKRLLIDGLILTITGVLIFISFGFPIITGYGAKVLCSDVFISGRKAEDIIQNDLSIFPFSLVRYQVNTRDSTATASLLGMASRTAKYRKGFGSALIYPTSTHILSGKELTGCDGCNAKTKWPNGDDIDSLSAIVDASFQSELRNCFEKKYQTRALLIIRDGKIIYEKYAPGFSPGMPLAGWSMAKSITNALLGILVKDRLIDTAQRPVFEEWKNDGRNKITLTDMMHMSSGLQWDEMYEGPSDVTRMLFKENDMATYALKKEPEVPAGKAFKYSSGTANLLSLKMRRLLSDSAYHDFPYKKLFNKIGMNHFMLETDGSGTFVSSSFCYGTARDFGRFGLLYLNDGIWEGERILPEGWVKFSTETADERFDNRWGKYGALWWVNKGFANDKRKRRYPGVPEDCFSAMGYEGQSIWIIPSKKLVVVRLSNEHYEKLDGNKLLKSICNLNEGN